MVDLLEKNIFVFPNIIFLNFYKWRGEWSKISKFELCIRFEFFLEELVRFSGKIIFCLIINIFGVFKANLTNFAFNLM